MNGSKDYDGLNKPPEHGSWYAGLTSDLQFSVDSPTINLGSLYELNNWTATGTSILSATTGYANGYNVKAYASNDGRLRLDETANYISRWPYANSTPAIWDIDCPNNSSYCGFGYTTSDNDLSGSGSADRFASSTKYAGFATTSPGDILADSTGPVQGATTAVTLKVSTDSTSTAGVYNTTIFFLCTPNY